MTEISDLRYPLIAERMFNRPHLVTASRAEVLLGVLWPRFVGETSHVRTDVGFGDPEDEPSGYQVSTEGLAYFPIQGTLIHKGDWLSAASGLISYEEIRTTLNTMREDPRVKAVLLDVDSPGGEAAGCNECAAHVREVAEDIPVYAVASDAAYSGAYWLASSAREFFVPEIGGAGSVGAVYVHFDRTEQYIERGMRPTVIRAGSRKALGHDLEPLSEEAVKNIQEDLDQVRMVFASSVAEARGLSVDDVLATEADTYRGQAAVDAGLADKVASRYEIVETLSDQLRAGVRL